MNQNPSQFYDELADDYHLILNDLDSTIKSQGQLIKAFIKKHFSDSRNLSILDCSCGVGTQSIGLALEGYKVTGTDINQKEIERAKKESERLGASLSFHVADFQKLEQVISERFDVVLSFDNAISHLKDVKELQAAFSNMRNRLKPNGTLLFSTRNYDELRSQKPCGTLPRTVEDQYGKRVIVQTWEWNDAGDAYDLTMFILQKSGSEWKSRSYAPVLMRAFNKEEINQALKLSGAEKVKWFAPAECGFYQPVIMATFSK